MWHCPAHKHLINTSHFSTEGLYLTLVGPPSSRSNIATWCCSRLLYTAAQAHMRISTWRHSCICLWTRQISPAAAAQAHGVSARGAAVACCMCSTTTLACGCISSRCISTWRSMLHVKQDNTHMRLHKLVVYQHLPQSLHVACVKRQHSHAATQAHGVSCMPCRLVEGRASRCCATVVAALVHVLG